MKRWHVEGDSIPVEVITGSHYQVVIATRGSGLYRLGRRGRRGGGVTQWCWASRCVRKGVRAEAVAMANKRGV